MQKKSFSEPDETKTPPKTKLEIINLDGKTLVKNIFEPGWKWSADIKPSAGTDSCQVHHLIYAISGNLEVAMDNGVGLKIAPGEVADIPTGHDAWVVGDEPFVGIDIGAAFS